MPGTYRTDVVATNQAGHSYDQLYGFTVVEVVSSLESVYINDERVTSSLGFDNTYYASVPYDTDAVTVAPIATNPNATVTVNGETVSYGDSSSPIPLSAGETDITIMVTGDRTTAYTVNVRHRAPSVVVSVPNLQEGRVDLSFDPVFLSASGGDAPYTFDVESGALPNGITLSSAGELSGTPTEAGDFDVVFRATDDEGREGTQAATLTIADYLPPVFTVQPVHATVALGDTAEFAIAVTGEPEPSVVWQISVDSGATWQSVSTDPFAEVSSDGLALTVIGSTLNYKNQYRAVASSPGGETVSDAVTLNVQGNVAFDTGGGSVVPSETVMLGEAVNEPLVPIREGHTFTGWYVSASGSGVPYDFTNELTENLTLYAGWAKLPIVELVVEVDSGNLDVSQGDTVTITAEGIAEDGHSFGDVTDEIMLASSVVTDRIEGNTVTFVTASPHVISVSHADGARAEIVFSVTPLAVEDELSEKQPTPAPDPEGAEFSDHDLEPEDFSKLAVTGADGLQWVLLAALMLLGMGMGTSWVGRHRV